MTAHRCAPAQTSLLPLRATAQHRGRTECVSVRTAPRPAASRDRHRAPAHARAARRQSPDRQDPCATAGHRNAVRLPVLPARLQVTGCAVQHPWPAGRRRASGMPMPAGPARQTQHHCETRPGTGCCADTEIRLYASLRRHARPQHRCARQHPQTIVRNHAPRRQRIADSVAADPAALRMPSTAAIARRLPGRERPASICHSLRSPYVLRRHSNAPRCIAALDLADHPAELILNIAADQWHADECRQ